MIEITSESKPATLVVRRLVAEFVGTSGLVMAVVGSGIAASRLSTGDAGLALLQHSIATGAVLVALIAALQPVSASFNPVVTLVERVLGLIDARSALALVVAQVTGGMAGTVLANLMFGMDAVSVSTHSRTGSGLWLAEVIATAGLVLVIFGAVRSGRADRVPLAVGTYIAAAIWFTSSTSFANPAVTIARALTDTFAGIDPASVPGFVLAQAIGGVLGWLLVRLLYPAISVDTAGDTAGDEVVVPRKVHS